MLESNEVKKSDNFKPNYSTYQGNRPQQHIGDQQHTSTIPYNNRAPRDINTVTCNRCNKKGHYATNCKFVANPNIKRLEIV